MSFPGSEYPRDRLPFYNRYIRNIFIIKIELRVFYPFIFLQQVFQTQKIERFFDCPLIFPFMAAFNVFRTSVLLKKGSSSLPFIVIA